MVTTTLAPRVLAVRTIPNVAPSLVDTLGLRPSHAAIGFLTVDQDDPTYVAVDEATKKAEVDVVFARTFYRDTSHSNLEPAAQTLVVLAGDRIGEVEAGMDATLTHLESRVSYRSADGNGRCPYLAHLVAQTGRATPLEALFGLDQALKAADVQVGEWIEPPTPTNMGGALVIGTEADCRAACEAFEAAVKSVYADPVRY
jgi:ethanolamine utilization protein EutL